MSLLHSCRRLVHRRVHTPSCPPRPPHAILSLCREGNLRQARKLFDEMPDKTVFSFSAMIYGYAVNGFHLDALLLFSHMLQSNIFPNTYTFVAVLLASARLRASSFTGCIHGRTIKAGLAYDSFVITSLLNAYSKSEAHYDAFRLFHEIERPALVSWNAMIAGFVQNAQFGESVLLFKRLRESGIMPNCITMMSIVQSCINFCSLIECESLHGYVLRAGFESNVSLMNSVLDMYASFGNFNKTQRFFMEMASKDVISWTNMMCFMLKLASPTEVLHLFSQMRGCGINADTVAILNAVTACSLLGDLAEGKSVHGQVISHGFGSELQVVNSLITMYSNCEDLQSALVLFKLITHKSLVSWTAMMFGYVCNGMPGNALNLLISMRREDTFKLDSVPLICSLLSSGELAMLEVCKQLHTYSFKSGLLIFIDVQNSLVSAYGRCGYPDLAVRVFKEIIHRDTVSCNVMIYSYGINGEGEGALALFEEMERCGEKHDSVTFVNVLNACSHSGMVDEGLLVFEKMLEERIKPRGEHYGCVMDLLARAGHLDFAERFAHCIPKEFASSVWKALLGRCHINIDSRLVEVAAKRVFEMSLGDASHVVLLSNVYASMGRFEGVESLRARIGSKGLVKSLGFSMVDSVRDGLAEAGVA